MMYQWQNIKYSTIEEKENINIYYRTQFFTAYKKDERMIKQIIRRNISLSNPEKRLNIAIYYKTNKTSHLVKRNRPHEEKLPTQESRVWFICRRGNCEALPSTYFGMTTMEIGRRSVGSPTTTLPTET